jgi:plasmid stabilization system protein ParE
MNRIVRLREEAERDLAAAAAWYEQQRAGLGHESLDEALSAFHLIAEQALSYPVVHRNSRALMTYFPFGVYFRVEQPQIVVVAIIHGSRHPRRWQGRT